METSEVVGIGGERLRWVSLRACRSSFDMERRVARLGDRKGGQHMILCDVLPEGLELVGKMTSMTVMMMKGSVRSTMEDGVHVYVRARA